MAGGQSKGRCKIKIKRIEDYVARNVTFSKRRTGAFKKASELSIMCGAQTAVIVFSPTGKAFSFGHPVVESVIDRFHALTSAKDEPIIESYRVVRIQQLNQELTELSNLWEMGNKSRETLMKSVKETEQKLIRESTGNLNLHELKSLQAIMETGKEKVVKRAMELNIGDSPPASFLEQDAVRMDFQNHPYSSEIPPYRFGSHMEPK